MSFDIVDILKKVRILVFDFDGTLVDSNAIKIQAFEKCFSKAKFAEKLPEILTYCRSHHHTPRFEKFRYVFENILKQPYTPKIENQLLAEYEAETTERIIKAKEIPGAFAFLKKYAKAFDTRLLSSTPHAILLHILEKRGMRHYFSQIQGAPVNKADWLLALREKEKLKKEEILFIGDTSEDANAAKAAGATFVFVDEGRIFQNV